jgi:hypothetical protein
MFATALALPASAAVIIYEPFDYSVGDPIAGQTNTYSPGSPVWNIAGTPNANSSLVHKVGSGSLAAPSGFAASLGNSGLLQQTDNTEYNRINLDQSYGPSSTLYYSVLVNVPSLAGLTTLNTNNAANNGVFIGFNNLMGAQAGRPSIWTGALTIRLNSDSIGGATGYQLGLRSSAHSVGQSNNSYWTQDLTAGQTYLVVVRYESGATAFTGGQQDIWVDPLPATWGAAVAPPSDGSHAGHATNSGTDAFASLLVGAGITTGFTPDQINIDEIRIGNTWADVTPVAAAIPEAGAFVTMGLVGVFAVGAVRVGRRFGFNPVNVLG